MAYESKAKVTKITATSRIALKDKRTDSYYTVEYSEERSIPDTKDIDMVAERELLWDEVNKVVDNQAAEIMQMLKK